MHLTLLATLRVVAMGCPPRTLLLRRMVEISSLQALMGILGGLRATFILAR